MQQPDLSSARDEPNGRRLRTAGLMAALLFLGSSAPVQAAYVDPGSGSLLLQAILAGILGTVFFFRQSVSRLLSIFRRKPRPEDDGTQDGSSSNLL